MTFMRTGQSVVRSGPRNEAVPAGASRSGPGFPISSATLGGAVRR
jgi:hypothetical protein